MECATNVSPDLRKRAANIMLLLLINASVSLWPADMKTEEVVAKHLDALGSAQARSGVKSRVVQGMPPNGILAGGSGAIDGKSVVASEGRKTNYLFKINTNGYRGEQFICDGDKVSIAATYSDKSRSEFGDFILGQDIMLRQPLLGGVWTTGWLLLDLEGHKAQLHYEGSKKVDGRDLIVLRFRPKRSTDLNVLLYFDPQNYQHDMTTYRVTQQTGLAPAS
jgi:hypothetical protein